MNPRYGISDGRPRGWGEQGDELSSDTSAASQSTESSSDDEDDPMVPPSISGFAECALSIQEPQPRQYQLE